VEDAEVSCGQVAGLINSVESAREIVEGIARDMNTRLEDLKEKMTEFLREGRP
jgi:NAD(P)H-dependent flavin oxidoreductase YrpB (nitropropane dioxygenase family)